MASDPALIAAAQRAEHNEISSCGTLQSLARQPGDTESARLLSQTLGEEESADYLLTTIADPILQHLSLEEAGVNRGSGRRPPSRRTMTQLPEQVAS